MLSRVLEIIRRELGAQDVEVVTHTGEPEDHGPLVVTSQRVAGVTVRVRFETAPNESMQSRLNALVELFEETLGAEHAGHEGAALSHRHKNQLALRNELIAIREATHARDVVILDGLSPLMWACASGQYEPETSLDEVDSGQVVPLRTKGHDNIHSWNEAPANDAVKSTVELLRGLRSSQAWKGLARGDVLPWWHQDGDVLLHVHPFAATYAVVLLAVSRDDELAMHRVLLSGLDRVERLVVSIVPQPNPDGPTRNASRRPRPR